MVEVVCRASTGATPGRPSACEPGVHARNRRTWRGRRGRV